MNKYLVGQHVVFETSDGTQKNGVVLSFSHDESFGYRYDIDYQYVVDNGPYALMRCNTTYTVNEDLIVPASALIRITESDINRELAREAYRNTSFNPERRGDQRIREYVDWMMSIVIEFSQYITEDNRQEIIDALNDYKRDYIQKMNAFFHAHAAVASTMIAGPANFPVRRNQKRSETAVRRMNEWIEWSNKRISKMRKQFNPRMIENAPIRLDDEDAAHRLQEKIEKLEDRHDFMKAVNVICRNKKFNDDQKRIELGKIIKSESLIDEIMTPNYMGKIGFESWALANNNAEIRRLKGRLTEVQREAQRTPTDDREIAPGVVVVENVEMQRLQIIFPDKPSTAVRALLKRNGFKWAPSQNAWQRMLNANARSSLVQIECKLPELMTEA